MVWCGSSLPVGSFCLYAILACCQHFLECHHGCISPALQMFGAPAVQHTAENVLQLVILRQSSMPRSTEPASNLSVEGRLHSPPFTSTSCCNICRLQLAIAKYQSRNCSSARVGDSVLELRLCCWTGGQAASAARQTSHQACLCRP